MEIYEILVIIFATSSGLVCIYSLISAYLLFSSVTRLSAGEEFTRLVTALYITVLIGFIYTLWNLLTQLKIIEVDNPLVTVFFSNLLISVFFVMLAYLAFLTKQMSAKFGFKNVGDEIKNHLETQKAVSKKVKRRKR
ncbi:MAG: hypothetical protein V1645_00905 [archaeon]